MYTYMCVCVVVYILSHLHCVIADVDNLLEVGQTVPKELHSCMLRFLTFAKLHCHIFNIPE